MTSFEGKTVLVTGAASGIGRLMALGAARRGASLVLWDLDREPLDMVVKEITAEGGTAWAYTCDVGDRAAVAEAAQAVLHDAGPVDVLVNNAGIVSGKQFLDLTAEDVERTFGVNTFAHFWTIQAFLPAMVERGAGHIVTISSAAGLLGTPRMSAYSASKHAVVGLTECLRLELPRTAPGVRTTLVCPTYIDTGMFEGAKIRASWLVPMLRPENVAESVLRAVERDRTEVLIPPMVHTIRPLRALPTRLFDAVARVLGVTTSMDHFVGHGGTARPEVPEQREGRARGPSKAARP